MKVFSRTLLSFALLSGGALPAHADSLLGIIGGDGSNALVALGAGNASSTGLINLGLGGDNLVDVQIGGPQPLAGATIGVGGGSLVDANVNVLNGAAIVDANVGGSSLVDVDIGIGGGGTGGGGGNGGGDGGGGNGGGVPIASTGSSSGSGSAACAGMQPSQLERLIRDTRIDASWQRASNVAIQRVSICPDVQTWLASMLTSTGLGQNLRSAVVADPLLNASISRSSYNASRIFAVNRKGNQLTVFVY